MNKLKKGDLCNGWRRDGSFCIWFKTHNKYLGGSNSDKPFKRPTSDVRPSLKNKNDFDDGHIK